MEKQEPAESPAQEELITDFSTMFKGKRPQKRPTRKLEDSTTKTPNWLLEVPAKIDLTKQDILKRRYMDQTRWMCISKAPNSSTKLLAAVVASWNYLCSDKGKGEDKFLTCERAEALISQSNPELLSSMKQEERISLMGQMLSILNEKTQKKLKFEIFAKGAPPNEVEGDSEQQKSKLLEQLAQNTSSFVYLAEEQVLCPIGFEMTPLTPLDAYIPLDSIPEDKQELWIINAMVGRNEPSFCIKRWAHIWEDLCTKEPQFFDIKHAKKGVQKREPTADGKEAENGDNCHCIVRVFRAQVQ